MPAKRNPIAGHYTAVVFAVFKREEEVHTNYLSSFLLEIHCGLVIGFFLTAAQRLGKENHSQPTASAIIFSLFLFFWGKREREMTLHTAKDIFQDFNFPIKKEMSMEN